MKKLSITWEVISNYDSLEKLYTQWYASNEGSSNLFNSFHWIAQWAKQYWNNDWQLHCYVAFHNTTIIAIAPLYIQQSSKWDSLHTLHLLGQDEPEEAEVASEYGDIQILAGYEELVIIELATKIQNLDIDKIHFRAILSNSNLSTLVNKAFNYSVVASHSRYLINQPNWSIENLSKNTRSRYKRSINQLNKIAGAFCWVEPDDYKSYISTLTQYHQKRWQDKGSHGAFFHKNFREFHQALRSSSSFKTVKMSAIVVNEHPIAINYYLADNQTLYFYQCGWDEANYANYSLGMALHLWSIEHCHHQHYDLMMGGLNDSYKAKFGGEKSPMTNITINVKPWKIILNRILTKIGPTRI